MLTWDLCVLVGYQDVICKVVLTKPYNISLFNFKFAVETHHSMTTKCKNGRNTFLTKLTNLPFSSALNIKMSFKNVIFNVIKAD